MNGPAGAGIGSNSRRERGPIGSERWVPHHGEALAVLRSLPDACIDDVVTDPPYSSGGFTRGDRTGTTTTKYTLNGTQV